MSGFAQLLGSTISESGDAFVLTPVEYMIGNPLLPALHGGAVASFLEVAAKRALARVSGGRRDSRHGLLDRNAASHAR